MLISWKAIKPLKTSFNKNLRSGDNEFSVEIQKINMALAKWRTTFRNRSILIEFYYFFIHLFRRMKFWKFVFAFITLKINFYPKFEEMLEIKKRIFK